MNAPATPNAVDPLVALEAEYLEARAAFDTPGSPEPEAPTSPRFRVLEGQLITMPAVTLDGVAVKLRLLKHEAEEEHDLEMDTLRTALEALERLVGGGAMTGPATPEVVDPFVVDL